MDIFRGIGVGAGIVFGKLRLFQRARIPEKGSGRNWESEWRRFQEACEQAERELAELERHTWEQIGELEAQLFAAQRLLLSDPLWRQAVLDFLQAEQSSAQWAAYQAGEQLAAKLEALEDAEWSARAADLRDMAGRVVRLLRQPEGHSRIGDQAEGPESPREDSLDGCILAAEDLSPSETAQLDAGKVLGIAVSQGSLHCHTAILARSRGIPAVVALGRKPDPDWEGRMAALDAAAGCLYLDPSPEWLDQLQERQQAQKQRQRELEQLRELPSITRDGQEVSVCANVGNLEELEAALAARAEGIGLFRTELLFQSADHWPSEEEQFAFYRRALERMGGRPVVIRTLDIGADKRLPYQEAEAEENPALGCRGIRFCLAHPEIFRTQLRAVLRASAYGQAAVLYPMVSTEEELGQAQEFLSQARRELMQEGVPVGKVLQGIMVETPAAALQGRELAEKVDFFSLGTNDLAQYTLAADRQNARMASYFSGCHPAVWRLVEEAAAAAGQAGISVCVCGDLAGDPAFTEPLLRLGIRQLSVAPSQVLEIRRQVRETSL